MVKNPPAIARDTRDAGSIPGSGRFPGVGNGNPVQDSCLENSMDRRAWWSPKELDTTEHTHTSNASTNKAVFIIFRIYPR